MKYIEIDDIKSKCKENVINDLIDRSGYTVTDSQILDNVEDSTLLLVKSYLSSKYNLDIEFSRQGNQRNKLLVNLIVDIMLYELHTRLQTDIIPEMRETRKENAIKILNQISKGQLIIDLVMKNEDYTPTSQIFYSSDDSIYYDW